MECRYHLVRGAHSQHVSVRVDGVILVSSLAIGLQNLQAVEAYYIILLIFLSPALLSRLLP